MPYNLPEAKDGMFIPYKKEKKVKSPFIQGHSWSISK